jgi:hypothetical protein
MPIIAGANRPAQPCRRRPIPLVLVLVLVLEKSDLITEHARSNLALIDWIPRFPLSRFPSAYPTPLPPQFYPSNLIHSPSAVDHSPSFTPSKPTTRPPKPHQNPHKTSASIVSLISNLLTPSCPAALPKAAPSHSLSSSFSSSIQSCPSSRFPLSRFHDF